MAALLHRLLQLLEGAHLDLAHPLAADAVLLLRCSRVIGVVLEPALLQNVRSRSLRSSSPRATAGRGAWSSSSASASDGFLAVGIVDQPVLPLAIALDADSAR